jgi:hypothetical protein
MKKRLRMAQNISEKRSFKRIPLTLLLKGKYRVKALQDYHFQGEILDVCFDGLGIKVDDTNGFKVGQKVKFKTMLYPGDFSIKAQGIIRWVNTIKSPNVYINMGMQLTKIRRYRMWCKKIEHALPGIQKPENLPLPNEYFIN